MQGVGEVEPGRECLSARSGRLGVPSAGLEHALPQLLATLVAEGTLLRC